MLITKGLWTGPGTEKCVVASGLDFVYAGVWSSPARVFKIDPETVTTVLTWTGALGENSVSAIAVDDDGNIVVGLGGSPPKLLKINPVTMTTILPVWIGDPADEAINDIACRGTNYYIATPDAPPAKIIKINSLTMTTTGTWTGAPGEDGASCVAVDENNVFAGVWPALWPAPGKVIKIDPDTMATVLPVWTAPYVGTSIGSMLAAKGFVWALAYKKFLFKIDPLTMTTVDPIWTTPGEPSGKAIAFDGINIWVATESAHG